jgi:DNA-directed RNA polymerase subunit RPC12/RpoP
MTIVYRCGNCNKKFKVREYMQLEAVHIPDDNNEDISDAQGRKCDSCGTTIRNHDKTCEM